MTVAAADKYPSETVEISYRFLGTGIPSRQTLT